MTGIMLCKDKDRAFLKDGQEFVKIVFFGCDRTTGMDYDVM